MEKYELDPKLTDQIRSRVLGDGFMKIVQSVRRGGAVCTVKPSDRGRKIRLVAEAKSVEAARELGAEVLGKLRAIKKELDNGGA